MTVQSLIELLSGLPRDRPVVFSNLDTDDYDPNVILLGDVDITEAITDTRIVKKGSSEEPVIRLQ